MELFKKAGLKPGTDKHKAKLLELKQFIDSKTTSLLNNAIKLELRVSTTQPTETLDFKTMPDFTIDRKREILSNFALKHGITKDEAYKYINEAFNNPTKNKEDIIKKLKECY